MLLKMENRLKLLVFDADDTLWECQKYFDLAEREYCWILSDYLGADDVSDSLFKTEVANMPLLGYGVKAFTLSLIENAVSVSKGKLPADKVKAIIDIGKSLLKLDAQPLPGVVDTLAAIRKLDRFRMVVFTKGEIQDQENKYKRSGLEPFFDDFVVVSDKTPAKYQKLCRDNECVISEMLMVGNSFKSDIAPVLQLGGNGAFIPHNMWRHEKVETYDHERLKVLSRFNELYGLFSFF